MLLSVAGFTFGFALPASAGLAQLKNDSDSGITNMYFRIYPGNFTTQCYTNQNAVSEGQSINNPDTSKCDTVNSTMPAECNFYYVRYYNGWFPKKYTEVYPGNSCTVNKGGITCTGNKPTAKVMGKCYNLEQTKKNK